MSNRILDYPEATGITSDDYILLDNEGSGAKCIKASALNINMDNYTIKEARGAIASFDDGEDLPLAFMGAYITALQDLHGYDYPWVGGSGKNKLRINSFNSTTLNGVTFTYDNGVINANGTATNDIIFVLPLIGVTTNYTTIDNIVDGIIADTNYTLTGCTNGTPQTYWIQILISGSGSEPANYNNPATFSFTAEQIASQQRQIAIRVKNGTQMNNVKFYPMIRLASVTDATFAPYSNICPISGWSAVDVTRCGKNLFNPSSLTEGKTINSDGSIDNQANRSATVEGMPIQPNSRYTISYVESIRHGVFYYDKDDNFVSFLAWGNNPRAFLTPSNAYYVRFSFEDGTAPTNVTLSIGETAQTYTPYNGNTYSLTFTDGTNPLTVYGGTVDLVSGVLTVNRGHDVYDGSNDEDWRHYGGNRVTVAVNDFTSPASGVTANIKCDKLKTITKSQQGGLEYVISGSDEGYHQFMVNVGISDITELRTWLSNNPITVVYELATPLTYQLTPTMIYSLIGENNIFANTGDSIVDYRKRWVKPEM